MIIYSCFNLTGNPAPEFYIVPKKYRAGPKPFQTPVPLRPSAGRNPQPWPKMFEQINFANNNLKYDF